MASYRYYAMTGATVDGDYDYSEEEEEEEEYYEAPIPKATAPKKPQSKVAKQFCQICSVEYPPANETQHLNSKKHRGAVIAARVKANQETGMHKQQLIQQKRFQAMLRSLSEDSILTSVCTRFCTVTVVVI